MARGSRLLWVAVRDPLPTIAGVLVAIALLVFALSRATWRPTAPLRVARRRAWGQILSGAARMYIARWRLFIGIGVLLLPVSVLITILQAIVFHASSFAGVETEGEAAGAFVLVVVAIGTALTLLGFGIVQSATARALVEIDGGRRVGAVQAYRMAFSSLAPVLGAVVIAVVIVSLLTSSGFLIPVAIWLAVRWCLLAPAVELDDRKGLSALRRSGSLVRGRWIRTGSLVGVSAAIALALGPLLGVVLIFVSSMPFALLNIVAGVVYALSLPFVALVTAYVYFDARTRGELEPVQPSELPAEIELQTT
jgi:hypothetical protein